MTPQERHPLEELIDAMVAAGDAELTAKLERKQPEKKEYMYLSDVHACVRHNYYSMAEGDKRQPFKKWTLGNLEAGELWEEQTVAYLGRLGFKVVERDVRVRITSRKGELIASGKIDGKVQKERGSTLFPIEIKSLDPNMFHRIQEVDDLFRVEWTSKYVRQLLMYLYGQSIEAGLFVLNDRANHFKYLPVYLGNYMDEAERTLQLIEKAHEALKAGKVPDRIPYNHKLCGNCQFNHICTPTVVVEGAEAFEDPELEALLERHETLKPFVKEFDEVHETVKALFTDKPQVTISQRFIVIPKKVVKRFADYKALKLSREQLSEIQRERVEWRIEIQDVTKEPEKSEEAD